MRRTIGKAKTRVATESARMPAAKANRPAGRELNFPTYRADAHYRRYL
jgi:hypothetical protein